ncbi:MAG: nucleotidyltransferase family protein [Chthoniobacteraceae bacterium]
MSKRELIAHHREAILALGARHGAVNVRVFGSVARGEDDERSDVDLLTRLNPGRGFDDLVRFHDAVEALLGCKVDVLTEHAGMRPRLRQHLERDAVQHVVVERGIDG